eukprot:gene10876-14595_t
MLRILSILIFTVSKIHSSTTGESIGIPPIIDIYPLLHNISYSMKRSTLDEIGIATTRWGFFHIINHGINETFIDEVIDQMKTFFKLPLEEKKLVERTESNSRGYTNQEYTKQRLDKKEVLDIGIFHPYDKVLLSDQGWSDQLLDGINQWPTTNKTSHFDPIRFKFVMEEYFNHCTTLSNLLFHAIISNILCMDNEEIDIESKFFQYHTSFLRLNYYPISNLWQTCQLSDVESCNIPDNEDDSKSLGISRHTDAGGLTILLQDINCSSLQVYSGSKQDNNDGEWVKVDPVKNGLTINTGDMLQVWSNNVFKAPEHRVLASTVQERYSVPFFYNPSYDTIVKPLCVHPPSHGIIDPSLNGSNYHPIRWGDFRSMRYKGDYSDIVLVAQLFYSSTAGAPTRRPTSKPSSKPSSKPTAKPSSKPSNPSAKPTSIPSVSPTVVPSVTFTKSPSGRPTSKPSNPSNKPTSRPSVKPSTCSPSESPSHEPTYEPTLDPTIEPTVELTMEPTIEPTIEPTVEPSALPSLIPSQLPTTTRVPTGPSAKPSSIPTKSPSRSPSVTPSSQFPSAIPSSSSTSFPTTKPTSKPTPQPTNEPTDTPTTVPTISPTVYPTIAPSCKPTNQPSYKPSSQPTSTPSSSPSSSPSSKPSNAPSASPTTIPTTQPSTQPTFQPSSQPTLSPSNLPSLNPSSSPSTQPSYQPSSQPSSHPTTTPTLRPSAQPTTKKQNINFHSEASATSSQALYRYRIVIGSLVGIGLLIPLVCAGYYYYSKSRVQKVQKSADTLEKYEKVKSSLQEHHGKNAKLRKQLGLPSLDLSESVLNLLFPKNNKNITDTDVSFLTGCCYGFEKENKKLMRCMDEIKSNVTTKTEAIARIKGELIQPDYDIEADDEASYDSPKKNKYSPAKNNEYNSDDEFDEQKNHQHSNGYGVPLSQSNDTRDNDTNNTDKTVHYDSIDENNKSDFKNNKYKLKSNSNNNNNPNNVSNNSDYAILLQEPIPVIPSSKAVRNINNNNNNNNNNNMNLPSLNTPATVSSVGLPGRQSIVVNNNNSNNKLPKNPSQSSPNIIAMLKDNNNGPINSNNDTTKDQPNMNSTPKGFVSSLTSILGQSSSNNIDQIDQTEPSSPDTAQITVSNAAMFLKQPLAANNNNIQLSNTYANDDKFSGSNPLSRQQQQQRGTNKSRSGTPTGSVTSKRTNQQNSNNGDKKRETGNSNNNVNNNQINKSSSQLNNRDRRTQQH